MGTQVNEIKYDDYDNFIFDLYGTLIDLHTDEHCTKTWKKWMKWLNNNGIKHTWYPFFRRDFFRMDTKLREEAFKNNDVSFPEIDVIDIYRALFEKYGNKLDDNMIKKASYAFRCASVCYIRLYPGVEEYINMLHKKGKNVYILSNAQASYTSPEIVHFGLDKLVDDYYISSDYGCMKPDRSFFDVIIYDKKLDVNRTIMIGDTIESDVKGALNAGMSAYQISNGDLFL